MGGRSTGTLGVVVKLSQSPSPSSISVRAALKWAAAYVPQRDSRSLLAHLLQKPDSWVIAHDEVDLKGTQFEQFQSIVLRLHSGEPLAYITGSQYFYGQPFQVTPDTLIPRPETEQLVEEAIQHVRLCHASGRPVKRIIDVGTGSGCIAISVALALNRLVYACDISAPALTIAAGNGRRHLAKLSLFQGDLLKPTAAQPSFDLILANLPYVARSEEKIMGESVLAYEPHLALFSPKNGLSHIEQLLIQATTRLATPGMILLEFGYRQGPPISALAKKHFPHAEIKILRDFANHDRILKIEIK